MLDESLLEIFSQISKDTVVIVVALFLVVVFRKLIAYYERKLSDAVESARKYYSQQTNKSKQYSGAAEQYLKKMEERTRQGNADWVSLEHTIATRIVNLVTFGMTRLTSILLEPGKNRIARRLATEDYYKGLKVRLGEQEYSALLQYWIMRFARTRGLLTVIGAASFLAIFFGEIVNTVGIVKSLRDGIKGEAFWLIVGLLQLYLIVVFDLYHRRISMVIEEPPFQRSSMAYTPSSWLDHYLPYAMVAMPFVAGYLDASRVAG